MAEYIKWPKGLVDSPEIYQLSDLCDGSARIAACCYMEFWQWFDSHARDYEIQIHSLPAVDSALKLPDGFAGAMLLLGLITFDGRTIRAIERRWSGTGQSARHSKRVYFIRSARTGHVKIGSSYDPKRRASELTTSEPVELLASYPGDVREERRLHQKFAASRIHGEWFSQSVELLHLIDSKRNAEIALV